MWEIVETQSATNCIGCTHGKVSQWVALQPIFEVCTSEKGYKGGGRRRDAWWNQEALEAQLRETLEDI